MGEAGGGRGRRVGAGTTSIVARLRSRRSGIAPTAPLRDPATTSLVAHPELGGACGHRGRWSTVHGRGRGRAGAPPPPAWARSRGDARARAARPSSSSDGPLSLAGADRHYSMDKRSTCAPTGRSSGRELAVSLLARRPRRALDRLRAGRSDMLGPSRAVEGLDRRAGATARPLPSSAGSRSCSPTRRARRRLSGSSRSGSRRRLLITEVTACELHAPRRWSRRSRRWRARSG